MKGGGLVSRTNGPSVLLMQLEAQAKRIETIEGWYKKSQQDLNDERKVQEGMKQAMKLLGRPEPRIHQIPLYPSSYHPGY